MTPAFGAWSPPGLASPPSPSDSVAVDSPASDSGRSHTPDATVIIVTYDSEADALEPTFEALDDQTADAFETVVVDNGVDWDLRSFLSGFERESHYVRMRRNVGVNAARNVGARLARADVLVFLDDDGVPAPDFVEAHLRAHRTMDIVAARGKVLPRSQSIYNEKAGHYDLGDEPFPYMLNIEGNTSVDRETLLAVGGFNEDVWGFEGIHLTMRLVERAGRDRVVYYPDAVISHDFVTDFRSLVAKKVRHRRAEQFLRENSPEVFDFRETYRGTAPETEVERSFPRKVVLFTLNRTAHYVSLFYH